MSENSLVKDMEVVQENQPDKGLDLARLFQDINAENTQFFLGFEVQDEHGYPVRFDAALSSIFTQPDNNLPDFDPMLERARGYVQYVRCKEAVLAALERNQREVSSIIGMLDQNLSNLYNQTFGDGSYQVLTQYVEDNKLLLML